jgi:hypothetical protein
MKYIRYFIQMFQNPWAKWAWNQRCEMCNARRFRLLEVGLGYWCCEKSKCRQTAISKHELDVANFFMR